MEKTETLEKNLGSISKGAWWFGIFGYLSYAMSALCLLTAIIKLLSPDIAVHREWDIPATSFIQFLMGGYISFIIKDAFRAIDGLIREMGEIV